MQREDGTIVLIDPIASHSGIDYGKAVTTLKLTHRPMVKGPHYRPEPAQAEPGDDPYSDVNPLPPEDPGTTAWNKNQLTPSKAQAEFNRIMAKTDMTTDDLKRADELNDYLNRIEDERLNSKTPTAQKRPSHWGPVQAPYNPNKTPKVTFGKTNSNQWNENHPAKR